MHIVKNENADTIKRETMQRSTETYKNTNLVSQMILCAFEIFGSDLQFSDVHLPREFA
jgi:hypothetical protein